MEAGASRRLLLLVLTCVLATCSTAAARGVPAVVTVSDISPDAVCCGIDTTPSTEPPLTGSDEAGQMDGVAADPRTPLLAYASGEQSGVWKTTNGGQSWAHASGGLQTGETNGGGPFEAEPALAVDPSNGNRLLFAASDDDLAPGFASTGFGHRAGLYQSTDAAGRWARVTLPGCPAPSVTGVAFAGGAAYAATVCGVAVSTDPTLANWAIVHPNGMAGQNEDIWAIAAQGKTVYACDNDTANVYRSVDEGASWTPFTVPGASNCWSLATVPGVTSQFVMLDQTAGEYRVLVADTLSGQASEPAVLPQPGGNPSGRPYVQTALIPGHAPSQGPGRGYSVFASNGDGLFELSDAKAQSWLEVPHEHIDQHGLALAAGYDPDHGHCTAYIASDGGVFRTTANHSHCHINSSAVRKVMHGLHGFGSFALGLIQRTHCPRHVKAPCPGLYLAANDNGTYGTAVGGHGKNAWHNMNCCGDSGAVLTDWRLPTRVVMPRGNDWTLRVSHNGAPPVGASSETVSHIGGTGIGIGAQVQTLPGRSPPPKGVYFAIRTLSFGDQLLRNSSGTASGWHEIGATLAPSSVTGLTVADGGATVYVLQGAAGKVLTLGPVSNGQRQWLDRSSGLRFADNLLVDPFDGMVLYATDLGDPNSMADDRIMASTNGGRSWRENVGLTNLAQAGGRFRMACGAGLGDESRLAGTPNSASFGFRYQCTLDGMAFDPTHPQRRFALLDPAGVFFSRDGGAHWVRLPGTSPIDRPTQAFFDPTTNPATSDGSLYVSLHGHGLIRLDAPWSRIPIPTRAPLPPPPPPKPPPPPPPIGATAVSLNCPAHANFPGFAFGGSLSPPLATATIHVTILGPSSIGTRELTTTTDAAGDYSLRFNGPVGRYTLDASYAGDVDHSPSSSPSCTVQISPPPG